MGVGDEIVLEMSLSQGLGAGAGRGGGSLERGLHTKEEQDFGHGAVNEDCAGPGFLWILAKVGSSQSPFIQKSHCIVTA